MAVGTLVFANGVRANVQVGGPDRDLAAGVRVIGSDGFIEVTWDGDFRRAVVYSDPSWKPEPTPAAPAPEVGVVKNALDCLETGAEPELSHRKALRASEIIFAFYESVRRHARVELPLEGLTDNPFVTLLEAGRLGPGA
jgi:predicted dehydrogenase